MYQAHPLVQERLHALRDGLSVDKWFAQKYLRTPARRGLGIGTGAATVELLLMQQGAVREYDLYEVSQTALDQARETARQFGVLERVRFFCQDINEVSIPANTYGVVSFISSLHHMSNLEGVLRRVHAALTPGGVLFADEYVGPDRFAFPERDTQVARWFYRTLDGELRSAWPELPLPNPADVAAADPTEAIHSAEILETVSNVFANVEVTGLQGTLAYILWNGLNHDALFDTDKGADLVRAILAFDDALILSGQLRDYFALIVARK